MLQDAVDSQQVQLSSIEGISSPIATQLFDFDVDDVDINFLQDVDLHALDDVSSCSPNIDNMISTVSAPNTSTTPTTTTTVASSHSESLCCFVNDNASFDFDPDIISTLLGSEDQPPFEPQNQLTAEIQNQYELNQLLCMDTALNGNWPRGSPDSVVPLDTDTDTDVRPRRGPWSCNQPSESVVPFPEGMPAQPMMASSLMGYMGMDMLSSSTYLDASILGCRYQPMSIRDGQMGFFNGRMGAEYGGVYRPESTQRVYGSNDMQVMGDYKTLVEGCSSSSSTPLPTSDISTLDDSTLKVTRLSPEERKKKIHRYLKKRTERNFNKKIKYACRKTLADSRPRVRGRFAKNDEHGEETARPSSNSHEYYDGEEVIMKEEEEMLNSSDILAHISGVNSFNYNYSLESWI